MKSTYLIITYNPPLVVYEKQLTALKHEHTIIVDNGSKSSTLLLLRTWCNTSPDLRKLVEINKNIGIAGAQNIGIQLALNLNFKFVLLLDHDSIPSDNLLQCLELIADQKLKSNNKFAAIGARLIDPRSKKELGFFSMCKGIWHKQLCAGSKNHIIECEFLNSSGTLIYLEAWKQIGEFDESFFIDHVETDWCMRANYLGFQLYGSCAGVLEHYLGDDVLYFWLFGWRTMPHRSPERHYTIVRNSLWLYRRNYVPLTWKLNNLLKLLFTLFYFSLFDKESSKQFLCIIKGFYDGILHRAS